MARKPIAPAANGRRNSSTACWWVRAGAAGPALAVVVRVGIRDASFGFAGLGGSDEPAHARTRAGRRDDIRGVRGVLRPIRALSRPMIALCAAWLVAPDEGAQPGWPVPPVASDIGGANMAASLGSAGVHGSSSSP